MPAGDLITADWQLELQGLLTGAGTNYHILKQGIDGLGVPRPKTQDVDLVQQHGAEAGAPDKMSVRVLLVPYLIDQPDAEEAFNALSWLNNAWAPVSADVELHLRIPGWGHVFWTGRPRGLEANLEYVRGGEITATAEFHALDPIHTIDS